MMLRCAIVDDEPLALGLLESYVNKTPFLQLAGKYSSAVQAMKELPDEEVDLLFLDIQMPELNGLEFSKMVDSRTRIVFTTAFGQYAIDGYRVNALDYLLTSHHRVKTAFLGGLSHISTKIIKHRSIISRLPGGSLRLLLTFTGSMGRTGLIHLFFVIIIFCKSHAGTDIRL